MRICQTGKAQLNGAWLRYYLLLNGRARRGYGICVTYGEEVVILPGLTGSEQAARRLLRRMVRGRVTPVTARDVAQDWFRSIGQEI